MYRFKQKARPLDLPALDLRLVDTLTLTEAERNLVVAEFNTDFGEQFLAVNFPGEELCRDNRHLDRLFAEYVKESKALRELGQTAPSLEDWSRTNSWKWMEDFRSAPHEGVMWFELQSINSGLRVGALQISQINQTGSAPNRIFLSGHAIMTLPEHPSLSYGQYWGEVLKALLDEPFVSLTDERKAAVFDEWIFPTDSRARYVARPGLSFGRDIIDAAAGAGTLIEREDVSKEFAPRNIRKTPRGLRATR